MPSPYAMRNRRCAARDADSASWRNGMLTRGLPNYLITLRNWPPPASGHFNQGCSAMSACAEHKAIVPEAFLALMAKETAHVHISNVLRGR